MDRVPAYEAVDRGSTPLGHTKKMRTAILLFYVLEEENDCILAFKYWGVVELVNTTVLIRILKIV